MTSGSPASRGHNDSPSIAGLAGSTVVLSHHTAGRGLLDVRRRGEDQLDRLGRKTPGLSDPKT
jgi:hypothetical protein